MTNKQKILIIKTGYSEFLENGNNSEIVSLGDILRTTALLHVYKNDNVTWLTDKQAFPLLEGNKYISRLLSLDFKNAMHLLDEDFDKVINLEKNADICKFANQINAWGKYGFRFDKMTNKAEAYDMSFEVLTVSSNPKIKKENTRTYQELLFEVVGQKWKDEESILGYIPKNKVEYDIGLNTKVGQKWPTKAWPKESWDKLEKILKNEGMQVTRQDDIYEEVKDNIKKYINWINSFKLMISNDSLGLHLAIVLNKKVLGLFGPTTYKDVHFYNKGYAILPKKNFECMPCYLSACKQKKGCMEDISVGEIYKEVINLYNKND